MPTILIRSAPGLCQNEPTTLFMSKALKGFGGLAKAGFLFVGVLDVVPILNDLLW